MTNPNPQDLALTPAQLEHQAKLKEAALAAVQALAHSHWVTLDTETTQKDEPEMIELGICDRAGETLTDQLLRPYGTMSESARAVHGITDEQLADAPRWEEIAPLVFPHLMGQQVVAWNAPFDRSALECSGERAGVLTPTLDWVCLMDLLSPLLGRWSERRQSFSWVSLDTACAARGLIDTGTRHRARGDAWRLAALLRTYI